MFLVGWDLVFWVGLGGCDLVIWVGFSSMWGG